MKIKNNFVITSSNENISFNEIMMNLNPIKDKETSTITFELKNNPNIDTTVGLGFILASEKEKQFKEYCSSYYNVYGEKAKIEIKLPAFETVMEKLINYRLPLNTEQQFHPNKLLQDFFTLKTVSSKVENYLKGLDLVETKTVRFLGIKNNIMGKKVLVFKPDKLEEISKMSPEKIIETCNLISFYEYHLSDVPVKEIEHLEYQAQNEKILDIINTSGLNKSLYLQQEDKILQIEKLEAKANELNKQLEVCKAYISSFKKTLAYSIYEKIYNPETQAQNSLLEAFPEYKVQFEIISEALEKYKNLKTEYSETKQQLEITRQEPQDVEKIVTLCRNKVEKLSYIFEKFTNPEIRNKIDILANYKKEIEEIFAGNSTEISSNLENKIKEYNYENFYTTLTPLSLRDQVEINIHNNIVKFLQKPSLKNLNALKLEKNQEGKQQFVSIPEKLSDLLIEAKKISNTLPVSDFEKDLKFSVDLFLAEPSSQKFKEKYSNLYSSKNIEKLKYYKEFSIDIKDFQNKYDVFLKELTPDCFEKSFKEIFLTVCERKQVSSDDYDRFIVRVKQDYQEYIERTETQEEFSYENSEK